MPETSGGKSDGGFVQLASEFLKEVFGSRRTVISPDEARRIANPVLDFFGQPRLGEQDELAGPRRPPGYVPPPPVPERPPNEPSPAYNSGPPARNEPKRGKARKCTRIIEPTRNRFICLEEMQAAIDYQMENLLPSVATVFFSPGTVGSVPVPRTAPRNLPRGPVAGSKRAQRGYVGPVPGAKPGTPVPTSSTAGTRTTPPRTPRELPGAMPGSGAAIAPPPAIAIEPVPTAPDTATQPELDYVRVTAQRVGSTSAQPVHPGSGPTTATRRAAGMPGTGSAPTARAGKTGTRTPVARPAVGSIVLPLDSLFTDAIGILTRRSRNVGKASLGIGTAPVAPGMETLPRLPDLLPGVMPTRTRTAECECDEKKERKPRQPRAECWKGSYIETAFGLKKQRRELVPC